MKISILHSNFEALGAQRAAIRLANDFVSNGHTVNYFVLYDEGVLRNDLDARIKVYSPYKILNIKFLGISIRSLYLIRLLRKKKVDKLISFTPFLNVIGILYKLLVLRTTLICQERALSSAYLNDRYQMSFLSSVFQKFFYKYFSRVATSWVFLSNDQKEDFIKLFNVKISSCVIANSYDPKKIKIRSEISDGTSQFISNNNSKFSITVVGRLADQKDPFLAINTIYELRRRYSDVVCNFIGDGELRKQLEKFTKVRKLEDSIFFYGYMFNPEFYIKNSDAVLITSKYEGIPNVLLESIALNTPIVTTSFVSGPKELLLKYDYEYVSKSRSPKILSNMLYKIRNDKNIRRKISLISDQLNHLYSQEKISNSYISLLR